MIPDIMGEGLYKVTQIDKWLMETLDDSDGAVEDDVMVMVEGRDLEV